LRARRNVAGAAVERRVHHANDLVDGNAIVGIQIARAREALCIGARADETDRKRHN